MYWNQSGNGLAIAEGSWLTLTWDVLKCNRKNFFYNESKININMRCIEIGIGQRNYKS